MSNERVIVRTTSNLSFAGELVEIGVESPEKGFLLKLSSNSGIKIWFPHNEINCIIHPNGVIQKGEEIIYD